MNQFFNYKLRKSFIRQSNGQFIGMTVVEFQAIKLYGRKTSLFHFRL
ncbi:hypothetical protein A33Q_4639 [Indibacter alkaliphilus LW1]|uniref:Uncharacterized protein n=1 Tax=Indibacter alkaliphilus (strain CCUG 57479 / KCTC 22604 / LW1) TaxID=1189612 RepID=S2DHQ6_INDAL|nr:hypothetical protein A33Q_4639 [Indibacter alkaliphilus LW1]